MADILFIHKYIVILIKLEFYLYLKFSIYAPFISGLLDARWLQLVATFVFLPFAFSLVVLVSESCSSYTSKE